MDDFAKVIQDSLREYADDCMEAVREVIQEVSTETVKKVRSSSPRQTGQVAKGWTKTTETSRFGTTVTVHGKGKTGSVAHLLENGHAKRGGGRVSGKTFIAPVESWAVSEVETRIMRRLEGMR